jgi:hypothetical protein
MYLLNQILNWSFYLKLMNPNHLKISLITSAALVILAVVATAILFRPVTISSQGNSFSSWLGNLGITAQVEVKNTDGKIFTFGCNSDKCEVPSNTLTDLAEGKYSARIVIKNLLGIILKTSTKEIVVDRTAPPLEVFYSELTNQTKQTLTIETESGAELFIQDVSIGKYVDASLEHELTLSQEGVTSFKVKAVDPAGNTAEFEGQIELDTKITLKVTKPTKGQTLGSKFTLAGTTDPFAKVKANGVALKANKTGTFNFSIPYKTNKLTVVATDLAGNKAETVINVKLATQSSGGNSGGGSTSPTTCTKFATVNNYMNQDGSVDVIVSTYTNAQRDAVAGSLSAAQMNIDHISSVTAWFSGILYPSGLTALCNDSRVQFISYNSPTSF